MSKVRIEVWSCGEHDDGSVSDLMIALATIPPECLASAKVEIESWTEYDCPQASVVIYYEREETEEERLKREGEELASQREYAGRQQAEEVAMMLRLMAK